MAGEKQTIASSSDGGAASQAAALFARKHGELQAEAAAVASECGASVDVLVFGPGGSRAALQRFRGRRQAARAAKAKADMMMRRLVGKDVSGMGLAEAKVHEARLLALKAAVLRKLREKTTDDDVDAGRNKIRRLE